MIWLPPGCGVADPVINHVWFYDFVHHRTDDGRAFRTLNILDEQRRECLAIRMKRKLNSTESIDALKDLFIFRSVPAYLRPDNVLCPDQLELLALIVPSRMITFPLVDLRISWQDRFLGTFATG